VEGAHLGAFPVTGGIVDQKGVELGKKFTLGLMSRKGTKSMATSSTLAK
jgi:hypothetical protein